MTYQSYNYKDLITTKLKTLPLEKQQQVLDFVEFLAHKSATESQTFQRVPDLHQGKVSMKDDFNEPLEDSFWLGES